MRSLKERHYESLRHRYGLCRTGHGHLPRGEWQRRGLRRQQPEENRNAQRRRHPHLRTGPRRTRPQESPRWPVGVHHRFAIGGAGRTDDLHRRRHPAIRRGRCRSLRGVGRSQGDRTSRERSTAGAAGIAGRHHEIDGARRHEPASGGNSGRERGAPCRCGEQPGVSQGRRGHRGLHEARPRRRGRPQTRSRRSAPRALPAIPPHRASIFDDDPRVGGNDQVRRERDARHEN